MKSEGVGGRRQGEFLRREILAMVGEHERAQINFNEFVGILGRHSIKFYSPEEFKKMSKIFLGSGNSLPLLEPFQYLDLHCKQMVGSANYVLLTRVLPRKLHLALPPPTFQPHSGERCLRDFVILMKRRYGNEVNWFKVVGGMTVSVSIQTVPFRNNLQQILRNTPHRQCVDSIVEMFAEKEGIVSWQRFMGVVKATVKAIASELKGNHGSSKISLPPRVNTEPPESILTIKSTFIRTAKPTLNKHHQLSQTLHETSRDSVGTPSRQFYQTRYRSTTQTEDVSLNLDLKKCTIHERLRTAINLGEQRGNLTASQIQSRPYRLEMRERRREQTQSCWRSDERELG